jgi:hypothetical protein
MVKLFRLNNLKIISILPFLVLTLSCNFFNRNIEGNYFHKDLGNNYKLTLTKNEFIQEFRLNDSIIVFNKGKYTDEISKITFTFWKTREELKRNSILGGCAGCGASYTNNTLEFFEDPDGAPVDVFNKQDIIK